MVVVLKFKILKNIFKKSSSTCFKHFSSVIKKCVSKIWNFILENIMGFQNF